MSEPSDTRPSPSWPEQITRRPALSAAIIFASGILAHNALPHQPQWWVAGAMVAAGIAVFAFRRENISCGAVGVSIFLVALALAQVQKFHFPENDIAAYSAEHPRIARVEMRIDDPPRLSSSALSHRPMPPRQFTRASVLRIQTREGWRDASGQVLLHLNEPHPRLRAGQIVRASGTLHRPAPAKNPGQMDWARYYRDQRILCSLSVPRIANTTIDEQRPQRWIVGLREMTGRALASGFRDDSSLDHAILRALVLGDRDPEMRDVQEHFRRTGTSHHLAISGMHVGILGGVVFLLCRLMRLTPRKSAWITMGAVIVYGTIALPSPPVIRSVLLCISFTIGVIFRRSIDAVQLLALSVLAMLAYHPMDIYNAGFQLSFGTVLGLMTLTNRVKPLIFPIDRDEQVALSLMGRDAPWSFRAKDAMRRWTSTPIAAALVAWLVSLPMIAYHFEQLNPWVVIAHLVMAPFVFATLIGGFVKVLLTLALPGLADLWASGAAWIVAQMRATVELLEKLPAGDISLPAPPLWILPAYYLLLALPLIPMRITFAARIARLSPAGALSLIALVPLWSWGHILATGELRVTMLSVGAGQACVMELPDGRAALIDNGSATILDVHRTVVQPFVRYRGRAYIDSVLISHSDYDHISGVADAVQAFDVRRVYLGEHFARHAARNVPADQLLQTLRDRGSPLITLRQGDLVPLGPGVVAQVIWPDASAVAMHANDSGIVLRVTYKGCSILFPGDIQEEAMRALLREPDRLRSDILIAPHHGSAEASTDAFIRAVDPKIIVSSNDSTLSRKQRTFEKLVADRQFYQTHRHGAVTVIINSDGEVRVEAFVTR